MKTNKTTRTYNLHTIMTTAWELFRAMEITFSEALKMAWSNAKAIINAKADAEVTEETHTWYAWKMLGYEVIHESKALYKVVVADAKTKNHTRVLSYFGASQVAPIQ